LESGLDHNCQGNDEPIGGDSTSLGGLVQTLAAVEKEEKEKSGQAGATKLSDEKSTPQEYKESFAK